jgi:protocatechuate 3,4-dioxygenase beta subunit
MDGVVRVVFAVLLGVAVVAAVGHFVGGSPPPDSERSDRDESASKRVTSGRPSGSLGESDSALRPSGSTARDDPRLARIEVERPTAVAAAPSSLVIDVLDGVDGPLPGAEVRLRAGMRRRSVVTGGDGEAAFENLAPGSYGYRIAAPGRPPLVAAAPVRLAAGEMRRLEVRLVDRDRVLTGTVVDQDGAPVAGLAVKARLYRPPADAGLLVPETRSDQSAGTAADGTFEIAGLADGEYQVRVVASEDYGPAETVVRPRTGVRLVVAEHRALTIVGEVTSTKGEAIADARVVDLDRPSQRVRTDEQGEYELVVEAGTEADNPRLRFDAEGYRGARPDVAAEAARDADEIRLDVALEPVAESIAVAAYLTDEAGAPVAGERLYLSSSALGTHYQATSDAGGRAVFPAVATSGDYAARVLPRGPYQDFAQAAVDLGAPIEIELSALPLATLEGRMIDAAGDPVPHVSLRVESAHARGKVRQVTGDAGGYFEVEEMPAGPLILGTLAPLQRISGVNLDAGARPYVELMLDWGGAIIEGRVVGADQRPLPGARVALVWAQGAGSTRSYAERSTATDAAGAFTFSQLGPGVHHLEVSAAGHLPQQQTLKAGVDWTEIRLEPME